MYDLDFLSSPLSRNPEISIPKATHLFDSRVLMSSMANDAVNEVFIYLIQQTVKSNPEIKKMTDIKHGWETMLNSIIKSTDGVMKEIQVVKLFNQMIEWKQFDFVEDNLSLFFTQVKNDNLRSIILDAYGKKKKEITSDNVEQYLAYYSKIDIISSIVDSILTQNESKVIYIDFWGTWCSPCLNEMPHAKKLKLDYKDKDIAFVYLGVKSPKDEWKKKIEQLQIDGQHHLLTEDEYNIISDIFQIDGIPHYVLIDTKGKIVERNAPVPSDSYLRNQIDKLLNE